MTMGSLPTARWAIALVLTTVVAQGIGQTAQAATPAPGKLNAAQVKALKALGIAIAVPTHVPAGFQPFSLETKPCPANAPRNIRGVCPRFRPSYTLIYRHANGSCFAVNGIPDGIGGGDNEFGFSVVSPRLEKTTLSFGKGGGYYDAKPPSAQQLNTPQHNIYSYPAAARDNKPEPPYGPYYAIETIENHNGCSVNQTLTPLEMKQILQSLTWL